MPQIVTIHDGNHDQHQVWTGPDGLVRSKGLIPRDFRRHPRGYLPCASAEFPFPLIPESEWSDRIAQQEKDRTSCQHIRDACGPNGGRMPSYDQDQKGYCWAHSSTSAVTIVRGRMGEIYVPLSAYMVACIIKGYRDEGGWGSESLDFIAKTGIPSSQFWPMQSMSRSNDTPEMRANAALHKCIRWLDLSEDAHERRLQVATLSFMGIPIVADFNWWSHSVCLIRVLSGTKTRIWNSWGDSWSEHGVGDLEGGKAWPDAAVAPLIEVPAPV